MEFDVVTITAIGSTVYALASDLIGMNKKWESNSVVQLVMGVLGKMFSK